MNVSQIVDSTAHLLYMMALYPLDRTLLEDVTSEENLNYLKIFELSMTMFSALVIFQEN